MTGVPIIDVSGDPLAVGRQLDEVCAEIGFFQIVGHGVDRRVADDAWDVATEFFDLPLADKRAVAAPYPGYAYGYYGLEEETLVASDDGASPPDLKETIAVGPFDRADHPVTDPGEAALRVANLLPDEVLPQMRPAWRAYYDEMAALSARLMSLFAVGLNLPADFFDRFLDQHLSSARAINYPHPRNPPQPGQLRAGAHTDYGTLTVLRQDAAPGGLEVVNRHGSWVPVPAVEDAFVINVGDLLARWTNDRWRSTMHRVVNPPVDSAGSTRRQSFPFFHNANWNARIEALPSCVAAGRSPKYPPVIAGPHLLTKFQKSITTYGERKGTGS